MRRHHTRRSRRAHVASPRGRSCRPGGTSRRNDNENDNENDTDNDNDNDNDNDDDDHDDAHDDIKTTTTQR